MTPGGRAKLSHLLAVLHSGEMLAADVAQRQSQIAPLPWMSRALAVQATQERSHACMAAAALRMTGTPKHAPDVLLALRSRIERDLAGGNLAASLLGLQGVVEHLGEALLETLGYHEHPAGAVLHALRKKLLAQEHGHLLLGARCLQALDPEHPHEDALAEYCAAGRATALQTAALLDDARLDAGAFWNRVDTRLSHWHAQPH
jgi:hypothetical protein